MTKPLTVPNREDKGDIDPRTPSFFAGDPNTSFPSYFTDFPNFSVFFPLRANAPLRKRSFSSRREIPLAAAFMAIV
jgi:hypothetical protein